MNSFIRLDLLRDEGRAKLLYGAAIGIVATALFLFIETQLIRYSLIASVVISGILLWRLKGRRYYAFSLGLLGLLALARLGILGNAMLDRYNNPYEWDFYCWYLHGHVAASGENFYDAEVYHAINADLDYPVTPTEDFIRGQVDVAFHYPPPTMLYFVALGWMNYQQAFVLWHLLIVMGLGALLWLLYKYLLPQEGLMGLLIVTNLFLWSQMARSMATFGQTTYFIILWLLLAWRYQDQMKGGAFLALSAITKPVMAVPGLFFLLFGKWRAIAGGIILGLIAVALTGLFFGWEQFTTYLSDGPLNRIPRYKYAEASNPGLLAMLLRNVTDAPTDIHPTRLPLFLILAGVMTLVSAGLIWGLKRRDSAHLAFFITLPLSIIIYPGTMTHYTLILALPLLWMWRSAQDLPRNWLVGLVIFTMAWFVLIVYSPFWVNLLFWVVLCSLGSMVLFTPDKLPQALGFSPDRLKA